MKRHSVFDPGRSALALLILAIVSLSGTASAQTTTGTLRGVVKDETGGLLPGVSIEATNDDSGIRLGATTSTDGFYNLSLPPGAYTVSATLPSFTADTRKTRVLVGQTLGIDFVLKLAARATEAVTVSGEAPAIESETNEIATNVTEQQIRYLPQGDRNFLNFAALAPGIRISDDQLNKQVNAAGAEGFNTNVFIDGTSYKNDILEGGVAGQNSSRGNPFPQNAVQEFRVISQNYKAEYEKATTAIITAVTKSGTNSIRGDAFAYYQNKSLLARDPFAVGQPKPDYTRWQAGADIGGPILRDSLHYFASYELNDQHGNNRVFAGPELSAAPPELQARIAPLLGFFKSPFKSQLAFGKLSWQLAGNSLLDASGYWRRENEVRDFGNGQDSFEKANDVTNKVWNVQGKHSLSGRSFLAETTLSYQEYKWNPHPTNPDLVGQNFEQVLRVGGGDTTQLFEQKRFSVREDFSLLGFHAAGDHVVKSGFVLEFNKYNISKQLNGNPLFSYHPDNFDIPFQAVYGVGNPDLSASNNAYGVYVQDDWSITSRLTVNAGIRWDYETDMLNNGYVTPPQIVSDLQGLVPADYFTDGSQRPAYKNMFQPRLGVTYDLSGRGRTILFAGYGRYFDRDVYNFLLDEKFRLQYGVRTFRFSANGEPVDGQATIAWNPSYLSVAGLNQLIAQGVAPDPDVFLINNNTKPPVSDQFSAGIRQAFGPVSMSLSYAGIRGRNGFTFIRGNRNPDGTCCFDVARYGNLLLSQASKRFWYDALLLSINRPYTAKSRWGASVAYTYAISTQTGNDLFTFDFPNVSTSPRHGTPNDERHRVVLSGIVGLPWDVRASALITLGSGLPFTIADASRGFGINETRIELNEGRQSGTFPYQSWDLRLQKDFPIGGVATVGIVAEGFNLTNHHNYGCFDGFIAKLPEINANFGKPGCIVTQGRRGQFGLNVGF